MSKGIKVSKRRYFEAALKRSFPAVRKATGADAFYTKIIAEFKDRQRAEIQKWRRALASATDPETPRMFILQDLYDNLQSDGHLISQIELRKAATLCSDFSIIDKKTGKEQPEKSEFFRKQWFYDLIENALDSIFRGYTLIELVDPLTPTFKLIPRRNVLPSKGEILLSVNDSKGIPYLDRVGETIIEVGSSDDLGIMAELCGQLIWKRNAQQSWAEYSEKFGFPLVTATTNKSSDADISRIQGMLSTLGEAAQAVLPEGTTIDIKEAGTSDNYLVYDKQIDRINSEISKPVTGGTMISDNGSSRSQSEVHERNLDDKIAVRDKRIISFVVNDQVIPILSTFGYPFNPETDIFTFDQALGLTLKEHWEIVRDASGMYEIPAEWVSKTFGFPIEAVKKKIPSASGADRLIKAKVTPGAFTANFR